MASFGQDAILTRTDEYLVMINALMEWRECVDRRRFRGKVTRQKSK